VQGCGVDEALRGLEHHGIVVPGRPRVLLLLARGLIGREPQLAGARLAGEAHPVEGAGQERVERRADEEAEVRDVRELAQRLRWFRIEVGEEVVDDPVEALPFTAPGQVRPDGLVEPGFGAPVDLQLIPGGEALRQQP
jgi:hypothetical protein